MVSQTNCQNQAAGACSTSYYTYYPDDTTAQLTAADPRNDMITGSRDARSVRPATPRYLTSYTYNSLGELTGVTTPPVAGIPVRADHDTSTPVHRRHHRDRPPATR